jgi:hypothetical protein
MSESETFEHDPLAIDPRPCELCGRTIDQHECIDHGEGPEYFCLPDDDIVQLWELADPRDAWRQTGDTPPPAVVRNSDIGATPERVARSYRTAQSTIDAFWLVAKTGDPEYLANWLAQHPLDAPHLHELWGRKCSPQRRSARIRQGRYRRAGA